MRLLLFPLSFALTNLFAISCFAAVEDPGNNLISAVYRFVENKGQYSPSSAGLANAGGYLFASGGAMLSFEQSGMRCVFSRVRPETTTASPSLQARREILRRNMQPIAHSMDVAAVGIRFVGANRTAVLKGVAPASGVSHYYSPAHPDGIESVAGYHSLVYENLYHNIDLRITHRNGQVKYEYVVYPGGNPGDIQLEYDGAKTLRVTESGSLSVEALLGSITEDAPVAYQTGNGHAAPVPIDAAFSVTGTTVGFRLADYDRTKLLIIDPWATYFSGAVADEIHAITTGAQGNVIVAGWTASADFPTTNGAIQPTLESPTDMLIAKFDSSGTLLWSTFYGGSGEESALALAVSAQGRVVVTGYTGSDNFPLTTDPLQPTYGGDVTDAFVLQLHSDGKKNWSTFLGGSLADVGRGIEYDGNGNVICTGGTFSSDFPITPDAYQQDVTNASFDSWLVKFSGGGQRIWGTLYGGGGDDFCFGLSVDAGGNSYLAGRTNSDDLLRFRPSPPVRAGKYDFFLTKFSSSGKPLWGTLLGGKDDDWCFSLALHGNRLATTGWSTSDDFPFSENGYQKYRKNSSIDPVIAVFDTSGTKVWATYFGGTKTDEGRAIAFTPSGRLVIGGVTASEDFPVSSNPGQGSLAGMDDVFIAEFEPEGSLAWSTFYGGSADEIVYSTAASNNAVYCAGRTLSRDLPVTQGSMPPGLNAGHYDGFVTVLNSNGVLSAFSPSMSAFAKDFSTFYIYPNPSSGPVFIVFDLKTAGNAVVDVFDESGRPLSLQTLYPSLSPGRQELNTNLDFLSPGVYFLRLRTISGEITRKLLRR